MNEFNLHMSTRQHIIIMSNCNKARAAGGWRFEINNGKLP